jgi:dTDP-4-amino-4,6-dideoxygalactose transaminase
VKKRSIRERCPGSFYVIDMKYNIEKYQLLTAKGRVALYHMLRALGIGRGDEVIIQAFTCLAVPSPILLTGAKPVYVDIGPQGYNIDMFQLKKKITSRTKAVIIQHTFGIPADIKTALEITDEHGLPLIEDCCHSVGSMYDGRETGTFGIAAFYSTEWAKPLNTGQGGVLAVNDPGYAELINTYKQQLRHPPLSDALMLRAQYYAHRFLLRPSLYWKARSCYRALSGAGIISGTFDKKEMKQKRSGIYEQTLSEWQKRVLDKEIERLDILISKRKYLTERYSSFLSELKINTPEFSDLSDPVLIRYPLMTKNKSELLEKAREAKIEIGNWFLSPVHPLTAGDLSIAGYEPGKCPVAEEAASSCINLPLYDKIREKELQAIFDFISENRGSIIRS